LRRKNGAKKKVPGKNHQAKIINGEKITETLVTPDDKLQLGKRGNVKLIFKK
jgi:hypothetical protein